MVWFFRSPAAEECEGGVCRDKLGCGGGSGGRADGGGGRLKERERERLWMHKVQKSHGMKPLVEAVVCW